MAGTGTERAKAEILAGNYFVHECFRSSGIFERFRPGFLRLADSIPVSPVHNASDIQLISGQTLDPIAPVLSILIGTAFRRTGQNSASSST